MDHQKLHIIYCDRLDIDSFYMHSKKYDGLQLLFCNEPCRATVSVLVEQVTCYN